MKNNQLIILMGPPGSGKGTLAQACEKNYNWANVCLGDLCRAEVKKGTSEGKEIGAIIDRGEIPPASLLFSSIEKMLCTEIKQQQTTKKNIIIDGFPRNVETFNVFWNFINKIHYSKNNIQFIIFQSTLATISQRLSQRMTCSNTQCNAVYTVSVNEKPLCNKCFNPLKKRSDDSPELWTKRVQAYEKNKDEVILLLQKNNLHYAFLDAEGSIDKVHTMFLSLL